MEFAYAARTDVPALIARVRELEAALKDIAVGDLIGLKRE
jgi:hypothetical protein